LILLGQLETKHTRGRPTKLDVYANEVFIQTLIIEIVCGIASEENDDFITVEGSDNSHNNKYVVLMDPLDGY
jgi:fructose-1,6-bisphosphatase I